MLAEGVHLLRLYVVVVWVGGGFLDGAPPAVDGAQGGGELPGLLLELGLLRLDPFFQAAGARDVGEGPQSPDDVAALVQDGGRVAAQDAGAGRDQLHLVLAGQRRVGVDGVQGAKELIGVFQARQHLGAHGLGRVLRGRLLVQPEPLAEAPVADQVAPRPVRQQNAVVRGAQQGAQQPEFVRGLHIGFHIRKSAPLFLPASRGEEEKARVPS